MKNTFVNFQVSSAPRFFQELEAVERRGINEATGISFADTLIRTVLGNDVIAAHLMNPDDRFRVEFVGQLSKNEITQLREKLKAYPEEMQEVEKPAPKTGKNTLPDGIRKTLFGLKPLSAHDSEANARKIADGIKNAGAKARVSGQVGKFIIYSNYKGE